MQMTSREKSCRQQYAAHRSSVLYTWMRLVFHLDGASGASKRLIIINERVKVSSLIL